MVEKRINVMFSMIQLHACFYMNSHLMLVTLKKNLKKKKKSFNVTQHQHYPQSACKSQLLNSFIFLKKDVMKT